MNKRKTNKPKFKKKDKYQVTIDGYSVYRSHYRGTIADRKLYRSVVNDLFLFMRETLFREGIVKIPERLGSIYIIGIKNKLKFDDKGRVCNRKPNWFETKKLWEEDEEAKKNKQLIYYMNEHTDGVFYRSNWKKYNVFCPNKYLYHFKLSSDSKKLLNKFILSGDHKQYAIRENYL